MKPQKQQSGDVGHGQEQNRPGKGASQQGSETSRRQQSAGRSQDQQVEENMRLGR
jgi:hypothetical protein